MRTIQKIAKNIGVIITGNDIFRLVSLFVIIYLAQYLGAAGFGKYSSVFAYFAFFIIVTDLRLYITSFTLFFISFSDFYATIFKENLAMEYSVIAKLAFKFVSAITIFGMVQPVFWNVLIAIDRQKLITLSTAFDAAVKIVINFILIPVMSYNRAAIATVATVVVITLSMFYLVLKHLRIIPVHKVIIKLMIAALVMSVFVYYFIDFNAIIIIPLAAVVCMIVPISFKNKI